MATRTWNSSGDTDCNDGNNYTPTGALQTTDNLVFDATSVVNCTATAALDVASIDVQSGYSGTLDFSTINSTFTGNVTFAGSGTVDLGSGTLTCSGDLNNVSQSTFIQGTATVVMDGSAKKLINKSFGTIHNLTISGSITLDSSGGNLRVGETLLVNSGNTFTLNKDIQWIVNNTGLNNIGTIAAGANSLTVGSGVTTFTISSIGTITGTTGYFTLNNQNQSVPAGTWDIEFRANYPSTGPNRTLTFTGNQTFNEKFLITVGETSQLTINNSANDPDITFAGDVTDEISGTLVWTKGTGTITLSGSANQDIDLNGESVEAIDIDKPAGTVTLTGEVSPQALTGTNGTLDLNGRVVDTVADATFAAGFTALNTNDPSNAPDLIVGGDFLINGASGNNATWNGVDLNITGTATAGFADVTNSDASWGTSVTATDCNDLGGNVAWIFGSGGPVYDETANVSTTTLLTAAETFTGPAYDETTLVTYNLTVTATETFTGAGYQETTQVDYAATVTGTEVYTGPAYVEVGLVEYVGTLTASETFGTNYNETTRIDYVGTVTASEVYIPPVPAYEENGLVQYSATLTAVESYTGPSYVETSALAYVATVTDTESFGTDYPETTRVDYTGLLTAAETWTPPAFNEKSIVEYLYTVDATEIFDTPSRLPEGITKLTAEKIGGFIARKI